jgi:alkylation response protein AidB-like acyl-CoA dehydrogenase
VTLSELVAEAATAHALDDVFGIPARHPALLPGPGGGQTWLLWQSLAALGATDLTVARMLEPHLDALAILAEAERAGHPVQAPPSGRWGVFAAEGPGMRLEAHQSADGIRLTGRKPWCSLAGSLDHALVTAWCDGSRRGLYAVDLGAANGVRVEDLPWAARGLASVPSGPVSFEESRAVPVGPPGWYLERPGFAWGGMGVAAIWYGGAVGLARRLLSAARAREPDQVALVHLGALDATLHACRVVLADAARRVDEGSAGGEHGAALALRVRQTVARSAEGVMARVDHALGPAPLALEDEHARRVADLHLYLRQEHAERDQAALGRLVLAGAQDPADDGVAGSW